MITIALKFLLAHVIGDFVLQPHSWVVKKEKKGLRSKYFWFHIAIHLVLLLLFTGLKLDLLPYVIGISFSHLLIDIVKIKLTPKLSSIPLFIGDQILHLLAILLTIGVYFNVDFTFFTKYQDMLLVIVLALILTTYVSAVVMKVLLSKWDVDTLEGEALHKAGWYIGVLERLFILGFVIMNYWAGIGFLIAAKSIFRFSDLSRSKDRQLTEYVLIGTLMSYGLAILIALGSITMFSYI
jgi:hypothetical protein